MLRFAQICTSSSGDRVRECADREWDSGGVDTCERKAGFPMELASMGI